MKKGINMKESSGLKNALIFLFLISMVGVILGKLASTVFVPQMHSAVGLYVTHAMEKASAEMSASSVAFAYFRYPIALLLLGYISAGVVIIPGAVLLASFSFSFGASVIATSLYENGALAALALIGVRALFVLPCMLFISACSFSAVAGGRYRRGSGESREIAVCMIIVTLGALLEYNFMPQIISLLSSILG